MQASAARAWWWLVHKDLLREWRAPRAMPAMLLLALALAMVISVQIEMPERQHAELAAGFFWLASLFASTVSLDRSLSSELDQGCWQSVLLFPVSPGTVFLAKLAANFFALCILEIVLVPAFAVLAGVFLPADPARFLITALIANLGLAATGTLVSALTVNLAQRSGLLVLLLLPLVSPVVLGAIQATRSLVVGQPAAWWLWWQLLACFAAVFVTLGTLMFEFIVEE